MNESESVLHDENPNFSQSFDVFFCGGREEEGKEKKQYTHNHFYYY